MNQLLKLSQVVHTESSNLPLEVAFFYARYSNTNSPNKGK